MQGVQGASRFQVVDLESGGRERGSGVLGIRYFRILSWGWVLGARSSDFVCGWGVWVSAC